MFLLLAGVSCMQYCGSMMYLERRAIGGQPAGVRLKLENALSFVYLSEKEFKHTLDVICDRVVGL
jgi:hypothetical protein